MKINIKHSGKVLVGADLSAAEVRAGVNSSRDDIMVQAYNEGKDLYAVVGSQAYKCSYEDCLESYPEGTKVMFEGREVIAGNEKEYIEEPINNIFTIPYFRLVNTIKGFIKADQLTKEDILLTDEGEVNIKDISIKDNKVYIRI